VRTDGSDSNNGLSNTAAGAFLTIQKAVDEVTSTLDLSSFSVTIQVADGAYNAPVVLKPFVGPGAVTLRGNTTTPANVTISTSTADAVVARDVGAGRWQIEGLKLCTSGPFSCIFASRAGLSFQAIDFGLCGGSHIVSTLLSLIYCTGAYAISGGATVHCHATQPAILQIRNVTVTLNGTPNFSTVFASGANGAFWEVTGVTFSGAATGSRYAVQGNAVVFTNGGGANYFPGNSAGSVASGGQYL
jgi:hypothetical protein